MREKYYNDAAANQYAKLGDLYRMKPIKFVPILFMLVFLTACSLLSGSPERVYNKFYDACDIGDIATAESLATSSAINATSQYGICLYTHDGFDRALGTNVLKFESDKPEIIISGNTANLIWTQKNGNSVRVNLYKIDGKWLVNSGFLE